jgi:hypothetical protein
MATARNVGYSVVACGHNSLIWKWDMVDTYKYLPASMPDLVLQSLCWLGRYFVETEQVFGASSAVAVYYRLVLAMEFRSEKIPRNRLGTASIIPRKKVLIQRHSEIYGRVYSEARNGRKWQENN